MSNSISNVLVIWNTGLIGKNSALGTGAALSLRGKQGPVSPCRELESNPSTDARITKEFQVEK